MKILFLSLVWLSAILLVLPPALCRYLTADDSIRSDVIGQIVSPSEPDRISLPNEAISEETVSTVHSEAAAESDNRPMSDANTIRTEIEEMPEAAAPSAADVHEISVPHSDEKDSRVLLTVTSSGRSYRISLRDYLIGVVMAEMPSYFHTEALRAQAVAARSYLLYRVDRGYPILDFGSSCTAHFSEDDGRAFFGEAYGTVLEKVTAAVTDTDGEVLYYDGDIICAAYHAMSYAYTANAAEVWGGDTPYLLSVKTPEQESLSGMVTEIELDEETLCRSLGVGRALPLVMTHSDTGRISSVVTASGDRFSGERFRSLLRLRSTSVTAVKQNSERITLCVRGWGHGVGMSQYGADIFADNGWTYRQILSHYYPRTILGLLS